MAAKGFITACEHVERKHYAHGLCGMCYRRKQRRDDPEFTRREAARQESRMRAKGMTETERHREWYFRSKYGITHEDYDALLHKQKGVCAVCDGEPVGRGKRLHVDHDHETGAVRGLLCGNCNTAIGLMADNPTRLLAAVEYLAASKAEKEVSHG